MRVVKTSISDILTRGESVRGSGKESDDDDKPMLPQASTAAAPAEKKSLLANLFGVSEFGFELF